MKLANGMTIDHRTHEVFIDGIKFPFYIRDVPFVSSGDKDFPIVTVGLDVLVDGFVLINGLGSEKTQMIYDPIEGDVGEWARRLVREGLLERIPWLDREALAHAP